MTRPPGSSRRRFLAGTATLAAAATLAGCTTAYGVVPDRVVHARTRRRSVPDVPPAVETTEDHMEELADEITDYATKGLEAWERTGERERLVVHSDRKLERAAEFAESLPGKPPVADTVESAGYHVSQAAGSYAYALERNDEFEGHPAAGADDRLSEAASRHEEFTYETGDPRTFMAYGTAVEFSLHQGELGLSMQIDADVDDRSERTSRAERVAEIYRGVRRSSVRIADAAAYREVLRERDPVDDASPVRESMADSRDRFAERIERLNDDRTEWIDRTDEFDGERLSVHSALYSRSSRGRGDAVFSEADRLVDNGYEVYGTAELAEAWLLLAAARSERDRIEAAGADTLDATVVDAAKRDATARLEDVLTGDPDPLTLLFADEARSLVDIGDRSLERRSSHDDEDWRWSRANGYAQYLLAKGISERIDETVALLADGDG